jgi:hypothetical protein
MLFEFKHILITTGRLKIMKAKGIFRYVVVAGVFCGMFLCGCDKQAQTGSTATESSGMVKIALAPTIGDTASYKILTQARRTTKWQGPVPDKATFEDNFNEERVEMSITQQIQEVDPCGETIAKITIDGLKCLYSTKNSTSVDFDSSKKADANNPLIKLVGQTYRIEFNPTNSITAMSDFPPIIKTLNDGTPSGQAAADIMLYEVIKERHSLFQLPPQGQEMLKLGGKWTKIRTFPFGKMGLKSYEKIYTLEKVRDTGSRRFAVIDMNAIPTSEVEPKYVSLQAEVGVPKMFDTNDSYTGSGEIDLKTGRIENYHENYQTSWFVALPSKQNDTGEPVVLNMFATRVYSIERVK